MIQWVGGRDNWQKEIKLMDTEKENTKYISLQRKNYKKKYQGMIWQISSEGKTKDPSRVYYLNTQLENMLQKRGPVCTTSIKLIQKTSFIPAKSTSRRAIKVKWSLVPTTPTHTPLPFQRVVSNFGLRRMGSLQTLPSCSHAQC